MCVPVVREFLEQNPDVEVIFVSRENFKPLFFDLPRCFFVGVNFNDYKGVFGLGKLAKQLRLQYNPDFVADLHDVLRSKLLDRYFRVKRYKIAVLDKGKEDKERLTDIWQLDKKPLKQTVERYADVFRALGFSLTLSHAYRSTSDVREGIGIAPFAQHHGKMLPLEKSFELARLLSAHQKVYFFGGGKREVEILEQWASKIPNSESLAGKFSLEDELEAISRLSVMVSMDSANMHLASLMGTRCVSIWGSTHPYAGFLGYGQSLTDVVQVEDLTCRPCSVFGDKKCYRGDYACLEELHVQKAYDKVVEAYTRSCEP